MKFTNLRRDILAKFGYNWWQTGSAGSIPLDPIKSEFSEIPDDDLGMHIECLERNGYINLSADGRLAELTQ